MQDEKITPQLIAKAKELLANGTVVKVVGWRKGLFDYDVTPSIFTDAADLEKNFVYNEWCGANLSKYMVKLTREVETKKATTRVNNAMAKQRDPNAKDAPIPQEKLLVFLKPCDSYSFTQLLKETRIAREDVYAIGIPCDGMKTLEKIPLDVDKATGTAVLANTTGEGHLAERCEVCKSKKHVTYDELIGEDGEVQDSKRFDMVEKIENLTPDERYAFWQNELSRCIRCNACRDVCPACTCEQCVFNNPNSGVEHKVAADSFEENMYHIIRAWHVAGRCTDCGECTRVCPQNIPIHLLNRKFIKDINEIYGDYQAGSDMETKPPMLTYETGDAEPKIVYAREKAQGGE